MSNLSTLPVSNRQSSARVARGAVHVFRPRTLRHPHVVGAIVVCAVCCNSDERCMRAPRPRT